MSVPVGTLTETFRSQIREFYGELFGWREITELSNEERLTVATGGGAYINIREQADAAAMTYEHFGVAVESLEDVHAVADEARALGAAVEPIGEPTLGVSTARFRHLLPMAIEVQNL